MVNMVFLWPFGIFCVHFLFIVAFGDSIFDSVLVFRTMKNLATLDLTRHTYIEKWNFMMIGSLPQLVCSYQANECLGN
jgi:hypothetical protein